MITNIATGVYIIQNVLYETFARATNDNEDESIVATKIAEGKTLNESTEHWWYVRNLLNATYTFQSWTHGVYAHIDGDVIKTSKTPMPFFVYSVSGNSYQIANGSHCWGLRDSSSGAQINVVGAPRPEPSKAWKIDQMTEFLPRQSRPLNYSPFYEDANVVIVDYRASYIKTQKLDVVVLLTERQAFRRSTMRAVRAIAGQLNLLTEDNTPAMDIRVGAVIYTHDKPGWSLSAGWLDVNRKITFHYEGPPSSFAHFDFSVPLKMAMESDWRDNAARVVIYVPQVDRPPDAQSNMSLEMELYRQAKADHMLLVFDPYPDLLDQYMKPDDFFYNLSSTSPHETVVLPETMMLNWIVASTLYDLDIAVLVSKFQPYVSPWTDSPVSKAIMADASPLTAAQNTMLPVGLLQGVAQPPATGASANAPGDTSPSIAPHSASQPPDLQVATSADQ